MTEAISESKLEAFWTADHALELLVVSGLLSEAAWFANRLGDWKTAFVLSVADEQHRMIRTDFYRVSSARLYFPSTIEMAQPNHLMMTSLKWILHLEDDLVGVFPEFSQKSVVFRERYLYSDVRSHLILSIIKSVAFGESVTIREIITKTCRSSIFRWKK